MKTIVQKYELLPLTRNKDIKDTLFYKQFKEGTKAFQIISNEMVRIACEIHLHPEFSDKKGRPSFTKMNKLVSQYRTNKTGLDGLPEFLYFKQPKSGWKAKKATPAGNVQYIVAKS